MKTSNARLETLIQKLTACGSLDALRQSAAGGYVPTVLTRTIDGAARPEHMELAAGLSERGIKVWTG